MMLRRIGLGRLAMQTSPSCSLNAFQCLSPHLLFSTQQNTQEEVEAPELEEDETKNSSKFRAGDSKDAGGTRKSKWKDVPRLSDEEIYLTRTHYLLAGAKPDYTAAILSNASKEKIYKLHKQDPQVYTVDKLAADFRIRKQRVHAILWLKEDEKEEEARRGKPLSDELEVIMENFFGKVDIAQGERHWSPHYKHLKPGGPTLEEVSAKEEEYLVKEFEERMKFNKMKMAGLIKIKKTDRRRPSEGWSYCVEELGPEGKRGKGGARRFVVEGNGTKRALNDFEKVFLKREQRRPRRRLAPR